MTLEEIKQLIQLLMDSGVAEIEVQRGEDRVRIKRSFSPQEVHYNVAPPPPPTVQPAPVAANAAPTPSAPSPLPPDSEEENLPVIKSPIVGTFYEAASPGAPPFVKPGDQVQPGQVLCIIESMKLMNEIEAEVPGIIVKCLVENGKPVEYGQALFLYRPL